MKNEEFSKESQNTASNNNAVKHSFINNGFKLSTNYKLLYELIFKGHRIPAWLVYTDEYEEPIWDLVEVKKAWRSEDKYSIGTRGIGYESFSGDFKWFEAICTKYSLHFIVPQNCVHFDVSVLRQQCNHVFQRVERGGEFQGNQCECGEWEDLS